VVIGGGVGGCSILYWLARLGWDDAVLVERADLTSGSTFHSAGLVGQLRSSLSLTKMMMESVELYRTLEAEVGLETGWREVGSLRLASSEERMEEIARQAGWAKTFGLPLELISPAEAQAMFPPMSIGGVLGAAFLPTDGYIDPSQLTFALAEGARRRGAEVNTNTRVTGIRTQHGRVVAVETDRGEIETEIVVNAGGMFAGELGGLAGVTVPVVPMAHEYLVVKPSGLPLDMPTMRDPSLLVYFRGESGGLVMGGYERDPAPWGLDGIPADFNGKLLAEDWDRFEELMQNAIVRVPELADAEVVRLINGPEAFTPDGEFILGPSEVRGFWVAAGFWNLRAYALQFGIFISLFTLIWGFFALLFGNSVEAQTIPWLLAGFIFLYLSYTGVQAAFIKNEMSKLTPEQREAMENLAKANAAANTKAPGM